jgi:hypothetical protein
MTTEADTYLREETERILATDWPLGKMLPLKRFRGRLIETGYLLRGDDGPLEPIVRSDDGPVIARRYRSMDDLLDAGWRAD